MAGILRRRRRRRDDRGGGVAALVVAFTVTLVSCGEDKPASTTTTANTTSITTAAPTTTASIPTEPERYASSFVDAWTRGERTTAEMLGTAEAVDALFAVTPGTEAWSLVNCEGAAGSSYCTFEVGDDSIVVRVDNETVAEGRPRAVDEVRIDG